MKKLIISCLAVFMLAATFCSTAFSQQKAKTKDNDDGDYGWNGHTPGTWDATINDDQINIQFYGKHWSNGRNFNLADLGTLPTDHIGEFSLTRESGKVTFKGIFQSHWGHGTYQFIPNPLFKTYLALKGYKGVDDELMFSVFTTDINKDYFEFLKANGYPSISNDQFKDLAQQNMSRKVMEDYFALFKTEGWGHQPLDKIVELREHGVNAKFVNSFRQMGYTEKIPLDKALELRDHGVHPEFIAGLQKMGYGKLTLDQAIELRDHGVSTEFIQNMQSMGYKDISLEKATELRDHGVNPQFIKSIADLGFKDISLDKAEELRDHGVNAEFIKKARGKGINVQTLDDYIRLRDTGFSN